MAHAFDHGLAAPLRSLVRSAVLALLAPLGKSAGGYLAAIGPFPRTVTSSGDEDAIDHLFEQLGGRAPAVLVALGDQRFESTSTAVHRWQADLTLQVLVVSNNGRGLVDRLTLDPAGALDDTADPGVEIILEHVAELLVGADLGVAKAHPPRPVAVHHLGTGDALTLWAIEFAISVAADVRSTRETLDRIELIASTLTATATAGGDGVHTTDQETPIP